MSIIYCVVDWSPEHKRSKCTYTSQPKPGGCQDSCPLFHSTITKDCHPPGQDLPVPSFRAALVKDYTINRLVGMIPISVIT